MDLAPIFNEALARHDAPPLRTLEFRLQDLDEFVKEAYRIRTQIAELHKYLRSIRPSYLSVVRPPRWYPPRAGAPNGAPSADKHLTDAERNDIDTSTKQMLRELNFSITRLQDTEQVRQQAESSLAYKKRAKRGLGALGRWAAGGAITAKSPEEEAEEAKMNTLKAHRESIIWYLQRALGECGQFQSSMMEIRIAREIEKNKSMLHKAKGALPPDFDLGGMNGTATAEADYRGNSTTQTQRQLQESEAAVVEQQLDPEQLQLFAQENQDMLKQYEDQLDQVRTAEKSLLEISELQSTLTANLSIQAEHINQLVADSTLTTENVGSGNRELRRATERRSTAQLVFWSTCAFCGTLILWDLFI